MNYLFILAHSRFAKRCCPMAAREQPPRICKNNKSKINCESAIGQHLIYSWCIKLLALFNFELLGTPTLNKETIIIIIVIIIAITVMSAYYIFCRRR